MVYDPVSRNRFLFGGWDQERERDLGDTWAYDTAGNVWTKLDPAGKVPSGRDGHSLVYDPLSKRLILFGGSDQDAAEHNDLWAYDPAANTWEQLETTGELHPVRAWHCAVYDAQNHQMLVFGGASGEDDETYRNDTWACDLKANTWTELAPRGDLPAKLQNSAMITTPWVTGPSCTEGRRRAEGSGRPEASVNNLAFALGKVFNMNRLTQGKSTSIVVYGDLQKQHEELIKG